MIRSVKSVLANIPGWEDSVYEELGGGLTNRTYFVERDDQRAVLKIDDGRRSPPLNSRKQEAQIQTAAAADGLASPVILARDDVYMTEYLEGEVWTRRALDDDANLTRLAVALRKLHSLPLTGRNFDARQAARAYAKDVPARDVDFARDCLQVIEAMPRLQNVCCCHNDLVVGNIIATPDIRFLDWEYACDNDPFFDLATVVAHHQMSDDRAKILLDAYFDGDGKRWQAHMTTMVRFYNALLWLWLKSRR